MELRKIARVLRVKLQTIQYHLKKMHKYRELYQEWIEKLKTLSLIFSYSIMDEILADRQFSSKKFIKRFVEKNIDFIIKKKLK